MPHVSYRAESRRDYGLKVADGDPAIVNLDQLKAGALLRIADATELMAKTYRELEADNARLREGHRYFIEETRKRDRQIAALKGVITKLKKHGWP